MKKVAYLASLMIFSLLTVQAQNQEFHVSTIAGIGTPILDNGIAYHIGVNPMLSLGNYFAAEAQLSYASTQVKDAFLTGEEESSNAFNALIGPRVYFLGPDKTVRPYVSLLFGGMYLQEEKPDREIEPGWGVGASLGAYVEIKQVLAGVSFDSPSNLMLKVGYTF